MHGSISYFPCRAPTHDEWKDEQRHLHVNMTSEFKEWDPEDDQFAITERSFSGPAGANISGLATARGQGLGISQVSYAFDAVDLTSHENFGLALEGTKDNECSTMLAESESMLAVLRARREVASLALTPSQSDSPISGNPTVDADAIIASLKRNSGCYGGRYLSRHVPLRSRHVARVSTSGRVPIVDSETLAKRFDITPEMARNTIDATEMRGVRTDPIGLRRRVSTNDRWMRYPRVSHTLFTDTMFAGQKSWQLQNKCAQIFATDFGWVRAYPMRKESHGPLALETLFKTVGVPDKVVGDKSRTQA